MLKHLLNSPKYGGIYNQITSTILGGVPTGVFGVSTAEKCRIIAGLNAPCLVIVRDGITAEKMVDEISAMTDKETVYLPAKDEVLLYKSAFAKNKFYKRITAVGKILKGAQIVITTFEALMQYFPNRVESLTIQKNCDYSLYDISKKLVCFGYNKVALCEKNGDFSIRGDILEVFPINEESIYRVDFFGDTVEDIRRDGESGYDKVEIYQATDLIIEPEEVENITACLKQEYKKYGTLLIKDTAKNLYLKLIEKLNSDLFDDSLQYLMPLCKNVTHSIFDIIDKNSVIVYDESKIVYDLLGYLYKEHLERVSSLLRSGDGLSFIENQLLSPQKLLNEFSGKKCCALQTLTTVVPTFSPLKTFTVKSTPVAKYYLKIDELYRDLVNFKFSGYTVLLLAENQKRAERIYFDIIAKDISATFLKEITEDIKGICVGVSPLKNGFVQHDTKLVVIGENELFLKAKKKTEIKKKRGDLFVAPSVGDFAVHEQFGVGYILGVKKITTIEGVKEYVELEYYGGDKLYVSTDQMDKLSKYLGGSETPTLNKIGGGEFERIKERVKKAISKMTINLKKLYRERNEKKGYIFSPDNALTAEFDSAFEFEETEDQITSIEEIKQDMESSKVMDRLLCGDVGFGKTEVAFRACFKAIMDGKQTAIVTPTTILSQQHYQTAVARFKDFGVRIAVLNRFRTPHQVKQVLEKLEKGEIDLVIGTHRLFSKDVKFKDLGLLVIDEEQRFGVEHKEKLKLLKESVDTLTLSATPIPRTLHLSLSGIRDISTINTPPKQRIPVQTAVTELTDSLINDAVNRELIRGGQVFILYNRVDSIYTFAKRVQQVVPTAKILVAHGQMRERELENNISSFYAGEYNVLIATTIIENGIDMPRANTLIVEGSDALGLSTLYQLKGRVGRGNLMAYAYFTYSEGKVLTEQAYKRLTALMEFTEMGSGYKIAMRDLEIRGAGNVLGKEQHGHMDRIGYELYSKLLKEELQETTLNQEIELDIKADAYVPDNYICNEGAKMDAYKQIAEIRNFDDKERVERSLIDNYGKIPPVVQTLINIAVLKTKASSMGVIKISVSMHVAKLVFKNLDVLKDGKVVGKVPKYSRNVTLAFGENPVLSFAVPGGNPQQAILLMTEFLS